MLNLRHLMMAMHAGAAAMLMPMMPPEVTNLVTRMNGGPSRSKPSRAAPRYTIHYRTNGDRETARRRRQLELGQIRNWERFA